MRHRANGPKQGFKRSDMNIIDQFAIALVRIGLDAGCAAQIDALLTEELLEAVSQADLYYLAGNARMALEQYAQAIPRFERASELGPTWSAARNNLAVCYERLGDKENAYRHYSEAARLDPDDRVAAVNAAHMAFGLERRAQAHAHLSELSERYAQDGEIAAKLAYTYYYLGQKDAALEHARRAVALDPYCVAGMIQKVGFELPIVYASSEEVGQVRARVATALTQMSVDVSRALDNPQALRHAFGDMWADPLFYLTYNGVLNVDLISRFNDEIGRLMEAAYGEYPTRAHVARRSRHRQARGFRKIRLAFVSAFFFSHSIWKIPLIGYYQNLSRDVFEIFSYHMGATTDVCTDDARRLSDRFYHNVHIGRTLEQLAEDAPDVIIYADVGMNLSSYCLTSLRMAPLQLQMLGHPETSGSRHVDYVVSSNMMEPADAQDHYREDVLRLPGLGCAYTFGYPTPANVGRGFFGLAKDDIVFVSPQSIFKYAPSDDDLYPEIAARVGERCRFVFIRPDDPASVGVFTERLKAAFAKHDLSYEQHVRFVDGPLATVEFIALLGVSDAFLDNPSWSGHNTVLDALHAGALVLAHEGKFMRQRHAAAVMRYLGFPELVAGDAQALADLCERYATNADYKAQYKALLAERMRKLTRTEAIQVFETFIIAHFRIDENVRSDAMHGTWREASEVLDVSEVYTDN